MLKDSPRFISTPSRGRGEYELRKIKDDIRERSNFTCDYCGRDGKQVEHITPVGDHGIDDPRNLIVACGECNEQKGDRPVTDFLNTHDNVVDSVNALPIYGDLILETPELPRPYREVRRQTIIDFRRSGQFSGANAYQKLEKSFRRNLWKTDYGYWLCLKYPERAVGLSGRPGNRRVAMPLISHLVPDQGMPVFDLLDILTQSAATRHLIDDIVIFHSHQGYTLEAAVKEALDVNDDRIKEKLEGNLRGTGFESISTNAFQVPAQLQDIPVRRRDLITIDVHDFRNAGGHLRGSYRGFEIRVPDGEPGSDVPVIIIEVTADHAKAAPLESIYSPAIEYDEKRAKNVIERLGRAG